MNNLLAAAYKYISNGICVIPTNEQKIPVIPWKIYQDELITNDAAEKAFELPYAYNIGIVTGKSSKNLEVIDIDTKYDTTGKLMDAFMGDIRDNDPDLFNSLMVIQTRSGGYHLYYRCSYIEGNQKLALRLCNASELADNPADKVRVLIETRGLGGYVVAPPSPGYKMVRGDQIPTITPDQREMMLEFARTYNQIIEEPRREYTTATHNPKEFFTTPWDAYNETGDIIPLLVNHGWQVIKETALRIQFRRPGKSVGISGDYHKEKKLFKVFTTSSEFDVGVGYSHYRVFKVLECNNDPSLAARRLIEMGYGQKRVNYGDRIERELFKKRQEGMDETGLINMVVTNHGKSAGEAKEMVDNLSAAWGDHVCAFWDINDKGRPIINYSRLINFLHFIGGFSIYYYDKNEIVYRIVQCKGGLLQEVTSSELIKKFVFEYIATLPETFDCGITPEDIKQLVLKGQDSYFSDGLMDFLPRSTYNILQDNPYFAYFPFRNGLVRVTSEADIELINYKNVKMVMWKKQLIDFDIIIDKDIADKKIEYADFINCISGNDAIKFEYACTLIGYLLHKYKDPAKSFSVILAEENDNDEKGGGTGKGIFLTAISKLINTVKIDGKNFKSDKNFAFQRVGLDTRIIAVEDTRKNMDFESFYSIITEGITVEKKNKDELYIPYRDSPKIVFTTNFSMLSPAYHAQRRQKTFDFASFFSNDKTPDQYFKHRLFDDWDETEWGLFYNFMFLCCSKYIEYGILETGGTSKTGRKHIRVKYGEEFLEWMDGYMDPETGKSKDWAFLGELYENFLNFSGQDKKFFSQKRFTIGIREMVDRVTNVGNGDFEVLKRRRDLNGKRTEIAIIKKGGKIDEKDANPF